MDDIAWVTLRSVQEPFTDLAARFAEYERLSGHRLDADRIRYYRVLAEAKILVMGHGVDPRLRFAGGADLGGRLIFGQLHRRLCAEALADVLGRDLPDDRELGAAPGTPPEPRDSDAVFDAILAQLRDTIVPRIDDPLAASRAKGIARAVKYLAVATRLEDAFREDELDDLGRLLGGTRPATIAEGRDALSAAITTGAVADADALSVLHRRVLRDDIMLRDASGALGRRHYAPVAELVARAE